VNPDSKTELDEPELPHVVIIGGGFGGLSAARALRKAPIRLTLVDRSNHHLFQPLLYQVAMAGLSPADIAYPIRSVLRRHRNATTLLAEVVAVDLDRKTIRLFDDTTLSYDYLIIAAGARTNYFGHDHDWAPFALGLKNVEDALEIRHRILLAFETAERQPDPAVRRRLLTFVIIGGGPTGVEIAGAIRDLSSAVLARDFRNIDPSLARVILIEMQERILPSGFDPDLSEKAKRQLEELGVEVRVGTRVEKIDAEGVHIASESLAAGTVLWTAGVTARRLTQRIDTERDRSGRITVATDCSIPGHPEVFAIGDNARLVPEGQKDPLPGLASVAMQQGPHVAKNLARSLRGEPREPFRYVDKGIMATIGRSRAVVQMRGLKLSGLMAWFTWLLVHIVLLIGFRNRLAVLLNWFWAYVSYRSGARLITGWRSWDWTAAIHGAQERARGAHSGGAKPASPPPS
jgi:NADH:ubiquinone reductase (H+-translocating)